MAVNGKLPEKLHTGFAQVNSWEFAVNIHPVIPVWFGRHFSQPSDEENVKNDRGWAPIHLLRFMLDTGVLTQLTVTEAIVSLSTQKEVWLPDDKEMSRILIGKFTQGSSNGYKRMTRRWVQSKAEVDFPVRDLRETNDLVGYDRVPVILDETNFDMEDETEADANGYVVSYYEGYQAQYTHLRASMLGYVSINLISMLQRFQPEDIRRVATDSLYLSPALVRNLEDVPTFSQFSENAQWGQWRVKDETLLAPIETAQYNPKPNYYKQNKHIPDSEEPHFNDPLALHQLSYLNGGGGSGKTTRAIDLFRKQNPIVLTPTHRLAKEMRERNVKAQTYHSFFKSSGTRRARCIKSDL